MSAKVAYCNGKWGSEAEATLSLDDWGVMQGAIVVERLRTCNGKALDNSSHVERLLHSCNSVGIGGLEKIPFAKLIDDCARKNSSAFAGLDFSIVVLVTPGRSTSGRKGTAPTIIVHAVALNWTAMKSWYELGQPLIVANSRNVPSQVWSPQMKTRCRLHYYLADSQAEQSLLPHAGAVLLALDGTVTETSFANIIVVDKNQRLVCPPMDSVLNGISLRRTLRLAEQAGLEVIFKPIPVDIAGVASEILLTGTSGCLWPASRLGDISFEHPTKRPIFSLLSELWCKEISLDFRKQAEKACESLRNLV